jgi:2-(1,2-epoxy-1,2-dihydrophenyl)acetyl-CoA isomerase
MGFAENRNGQKIDRFNKAGANGSIQHEQGCPITGGRERQIMGETICLDVDCHTFSSWRSEKIGVIQFKTDFLLRTSDLTERDTILEYLDLLSKDDSVRVIILFGAPDSKGRREFFDFFSQARQKDLDYIFIHRMLNVVSQIILKLIDLQKFIIYANSGKVLSYFLNIGLASDWIILADNAVIQNPSIELGLMPIGGGVYFLQKKFGLKRTCDILLSEKDITASEANSMGLSDQVVPVEMLKDAAYRAAAKFCRRPVSFLCGIKRLLNYSYKDLNDYLAYENDVFIKTIRYSTFWKS